MKSKKNSRKRSKIMIIKTSKKIPINTTAYMEFMKEFRQKHGKKSNVLLEGSKKWRQMTDQEKSKWVHLVEEMQKKQKNIVIKHEMGYHKILFTEPATFNSSRYFGKQNKVSNEISLKVTDKFYNMLLNKPKNGICRKDMHFRFGNGNAYFFGSKKFPLDQYKFLGGHGNDVAQTGLIDEELMAQNMIDLGSDNSYENIWLKSYGKSTNYSWDNKSSLKKIRKIFPEVLFVGNTKGGDVGAHLYAHYDKDNNIDGLIIENNCVFPPRSEPSWYKR